MTHRLLAAAFADDRGLIQDVIEGPLDAVTRITSFKGAVRGNHFHRETIQWTYVLTGCLLVASGHGQDYTERTVGPGDIVVDVPGEPHAWKALEDTDCLVFTCGPRAGEGYENDTTRLDKPLLS